MSARPRSRRYVRCLLCDRPVTINNLTNHVRMSHPASARVPRRELYDELEPAELPAVVERAPRARVEEAPASYSSGGDPASEPPPLELDDVVLAVVESLAEPSGLLPVAHLAAVFAWRDATDVFLRSVRGSTSPGEAPRRP